MIVSEITAEAFCSSIEIALAHPPNIEKSIRKIQRTINGLPDGKIIISVRGNNVFFYTVIEGKQKYLSKKSNQIYALLRRRYLTVLIEILKLSHSKRVLDIRRRNLMISKLQELIRTCEIGNLDIARIILTNHQYNWFNGPFRQKPIDEDTPHISAGGVPTRSKSERDIANANEALAVPYHYEEEQVIFVKPLVMNLLECLREEGMLRGKLYTYINGSIHWLVPDELQWMNSPGSIWKTYDAQKGTIRIYNDFKVMLADDSMFFWEHEGLIENFRYRRNATERAAVMKYTETADDEHFLETFERDINTPEKRERLIQYQILPRLWF